MTPTQMPKYFYHTVRLGKSELQNQKARFAQVLGKEKLEALIEREEGHQSQVSDSPKLSSFIQGLISKQSGYS